MQGLELLRPNGPHCPNRPHRPNRQHWSKGSTGRTDNMNRPHWPIRRMARVLLPHFDNSRAGSDPRAESVWVEFSGCCFFVGRVSRQLSDETSYATSGTARNPFAIGSSQGGGPPGCRLRSVRFLRSERCEITTPPYHFGQAMQFCRLMPTFFA